MSKKEMAKEMQFFAACLQEARHISRLLEDAQMRMLLDGKPPLDVMKGSIILQGLEHVSHALNHFLEEQARSNEKKEIVVEERPAAEPASPLNGAARPAGEHAAAAS